MKKLIKTHLAIISGTLLTLALLTPSYALDYSEAYKVAGTDTAGLAGSSNEHLYYACDSKECNVIKTKLQPFDEALKLYDDEISRLINSADSPEINSLSKKIEALDEKIKQESQKENANVSALQLEKSTLILDLVNEAGKINPYITTIKLIIIPQVETRKVLIEELKEAAGDGFISKIKNNTDDDTFDGGIEEK